MDVLQNHREAIVDGLHVRLTTLTTALPLPRSTMPATMVLPSGSAPGVELLVGVLVPFLAPDVGLVNLDLAEEGDAVFLGHQVDGFA